MNLAEAGGLRFFARALPPWHYYAAIVGMVRYLAKVVGIGIVIRPTPPPREIGVQYGTQKKGTRPRIDASHQRKMSEVIWEFAGDVIRTGDSPEEKQSMLNAACSAWSIACKPPDMRGQHLVWLFPSPSALYACGRLPFTSGMPVRKIASCWWLTYARKMYSFQ